MKKNFQWSFLNKIQDVKFISSMYIWIFVVPIAAKLLSKTNEIIFVTIFNHPFELNLGLPFSWKMFYFSALFFTIATVIYQTKCPRLIREYPNFSAFEQESRPEWHLRSYANDIKINFEEYKEWLQDSMNEQDGVVKSGKDFTSSLFWHLQWEADRKRTAFMWACIAAYTVGFIFLFVVFCQNLWWVIKLSFNLI